MSNNNDYLKIELWHSMILIVFVTVNVSLTGIWPGSFDTCFCSDEEEERWLKTSIVQNAKELSAQREASQRHL